jgi:hypothetical protein
VVEICQRLEDLGRAGNTENAAVLLGELKAMFARTREALLQICEA